MKALKLSALFLAAFAFVAHAANDVVEKQVTGEAAIVNGDEIRARDDAKRAALREAVEQVAGVMISADTLTANSQLVSDRIYANSAGYVQSYEQVGQAQKEGNVVRVTYKVKVGTAQLEKDVLAVKALINRFGSPRLVILTQEQAIDAKGVTTSSGVMSTVLTDGFKKDGWTILDPHFASGKLRLAPGATLGPTEVKEIADLSKADYIIYGNVNFRYQAVTDSPMLNTATGASGGGQLLFPVTGEYDLGVFATDSGSQLAKISGKFDCDMKNPDPSKRVSPLISYERTAYDITTKKGQDIVGNVRKAVLEYLRNAEQNGNRVVMNVSGLTEFAAVQNFKRIVSQATGVREVKPGTFGHGKAVFDVVYVGETDALAEYLGGKKFKGHTISVTGVTGNTLELTLAK